MRDWCFRDLVIVQTEIDVQLSRGANLFREPDRNFDHFLCRDRALPIESLLDST